MVVVVAVVMIVGMVVIVNVVPIVTMRMASASVPCDTIDQKDFSLTPERRPDFKEAEEESGASSM